jgi:predicted nucleic acid-binding protein
VIVVDTSIVIDYARGKDAKLVALLPTLDPAICGIVRAELLCGARNAKHRSELATLLATFNQLPIPEMLWDVVGDTLAAMRVRGMTVPLADAAIATLALEHDCEVWSVDPHFKAMQKCIPRLKLYQPPP